MKPSKTAIGPRVRVGHVHLKVTDLERAIGFYRGVLDLELMQRYGPEAAFPSAGGYHHHIALTTWESKGRTDLFHLALLCHDRRKLADALIWLNAAGIPLDGASDHGVSKALYLRDPDDNGLELYQDRPPDAWPKNPDGSLAMHTRPLDVEILL